MAIPLQPVPVDVPTEQRNPRTGDIDQLSTLDVLKKINAEDLVVPYAVAGVLPQLAKIVDFAAQALREGKRVHYFGAGTSGRLAVLDAAELRPTFSLPPDTFIAHHAGGERALYDAVENAEDDADAGAAEVRRDVVAGDVVIGIAASGRTPYVLGALRAAHLLGAHTALISANPRASANVDVDVPITVDTGPEAIAGSTRMKAGNAQKMVLTAFSTAVMIKLGYTYSNLMVSMHATNAKLRGRTLRILQEATGAPLADCVEALTASGGDLKIALVHLLSGADPACARIALEQHHGHVARALAALGATRVKA